MGMFCYQCQETARGTGCNVMGVCGKNENVAKLQDLLIYILKGISEIKVKANLNVSDLKEINHEVIKSLFMTITNANFDEAAFEAEINKMISLRDKLRETVVLENMHDSSTFEVSTIEKMIAYGDKVGVLATDNEDVRSLRELIIYGLKG
ncbi:MAG TPA: hydroxylamine reductase, partial [Clostridia bacterium]|nr:hydroxylamine reductase [Clostridia bacterium]